MLGLKLTMLVKGAIGVFIQATRHNLNQCRLRPMTPYDVTIPHSLKLSYTIWCVWQRWTTLVQIMACCLMASSYYMNQYCQTGIINYIIRITFQWALFEMHFSYKKMDLIINMKNSILISTWYSPFATSNGRFFSDTTICMMPSTNLHNFW